MEIETYNIGTIPVGAERILRCGQDFLLMENPTPAHTGKDIPFLIHDAVSIYCREGALTFRFNLKEIRLMVGSFLILLPGQTIESMTGWDSFKGTISLMSPSFTESLAIGSSFRFQDTVERTPCHRFTEEGDRAISLYYEMCARTMAYPDNPNCREILRLLTKAFFLGMGYYIHSPEGEIAAPSRADQITAEFMALVADEHKEHRELEYYARRLCITPKHLSTTIRQQTGKTATEWIERSVVLDAMALLSSTHGSVLEISETLGFPSQSFFGKYFKRLTGKSPAQYRKEI